MKPLLLLLLLLPLAAQVPAFVSTDFNSGIGAFTSTQSDYSEWRAGDKIVVLFLTVDDVQFETFNRGWIELDHRPVPLPTLIPLPLPPRYFARLLMTTAQVDNPAYPFLFNTPTVFIAMTAVYRGVIGTDLHIAVDGLTIPQTATRQPNERVVLYFATNDLTKFLPPLGTTPRQDLDNSTSPALHILVADQEKAIAGTVGPYAAIAPGDGVSFLLSLVGPPPPVTPKPGKGKGKGKQWK